MTDNAKLIAELLRRINEASRSTVDGPKGHRASAMYLLKRLHEAQAVLTDCRAALAAQSEPSPVASAQVPRANRSELRRFVDNNMTFMDVLPDKPTDGPNIPVLSSVSKRIWYHATDDITSYPFSAVIDASLAERNANG